MSTSILYHVNQHLVFWPHALYVTNAHTAHGWAIVTVKFLFSASVNDSLYLEASLEVAEASLEASTLLTSSITVVRSAARTNERNGGVDLRVT